MMVSQICIESTATPKLATISKVMTSIHYLIECIPSFRAGLMQNMDPISSIQLRRALGKNPWMSPLETLKYASIAAFLGINMDWLTFVSRAGCDIALLGDLGDVQLVIDGWEHRTTVKHPFHIIMICTVLRGPGPPPPEAHDMKWALGDCELFSNSRGDQELHMVRDGVHLVILVPNINLASNQTLVLRLEGKVIESIFSKFHDARCIWMNTELFPTKSNLLRTVSTVSMASHRPPQYGDEPYKILDFVGLGIEVFWWTSSMDWVALKEKHRLNATLLLPPDRIDDPRFHPGLIEGYA
ncbi:hypothetical protein V502_00605 [Pseudogymnoascus sp. VKM F-4520 (FW-2644)]|nr:hypothetical protein V502_00605 [Pseudogymnoascus sp. VKM F-4520 (FW-2644)]